MWEKANGISQIQQRKELCMAALNDYKCDYCFFILKDELEKPFSCPVCTREGTFDVTFENWKTFNSGTRDIIRDELVDSKGMRRQFTAGECPTSARELGLLPADGIRSFSNEQQQEYVGRYMRDGDSPKLRQDILKEREKNTGEKLYS